MATNEQNEDNPTLKKVESEHIAKVKNKLESLYVIWDNVGADEDQKRDRSNQVWGYVFDLLKDIVDEETELYENIKERIKNYEKQIAELSTELDLPATEKVTGTLIDREERLRQLLDELSKFKVMRLKEFQELRVQELKYCELLGLEPIELSSTTGTPTEGCIYELQQRLNRLKDEKEHRQKKFYMLKKELTTILEITELVPETRLEKEILTSKEDSLSLSKETFEVLERFVTKSKDKKADLENEKAFLMDKLFLLWDVLKVEEGDRDKFLFKHSDCRISNLNSIKEEIARCETIKRENISKYVDALKEELLSLWKKCFISKSDKKLSFFEVDEVNETVLEAYNNEVAKWRKYYKDTEHILQKIQRRHELWDLMIVFENKANDPNRFKNRGGNLLQEERERKKLQKDLPALENEIYVAIEKYEEESGKLFLYFGDNFRVFVAKQLEDRLAQKENEKIRKLTKQHTVGTPRTKQHTVGTPPVGTPPAKRPGFTPKSAPSKLLKSSVGVPIYRTPNFSVSKKFPSTVAKMKTRKLSKLQSPLSTKKSENNILREIKENKMVKEKNENKDDGSNCLDSTSYANFSEKLDRPSRQAHRSSVLSSRKISGTRISINKSKRKSTNKSIQKSLTKR